MTDVDTARLIYDLKTIGEVKSDDIRCLLRGCMWMDAMKESGHPFEALIRERAWELYYLLDFQRSVAEEAKKKSSEFGQDRWFP